MSVTTERRRADAGPLWAGPVGFTALGALLAVLAWFTAGVFGEAADDGSPHLSGATYVAGATAVQSPAPSAAADLVANARLVKPLEDIHKGDRVLYQGHLCTWREWGGNINTSQIRCGTQTFAIQTGRLTPVELKDGPSKLVVRHS